MGTRPSEEIWFTAVAKVVSLVLFLGRWGNVIVVSTEEISIISIS
jgi:hypothetical protein